MNSHRKRIASYIVTVIFMFFAFSSNYAATAVSVYSGIIKSIVVATDAITETVIGQLDVANPDFLLAYPYNRVKFSKNSKEAYSYLLSLYMSGKTMSFYVDTNGTTLGMA